MAWTNYHNHCHYCDGKFSVEDHVISAIEKNLIALGMSSHCPVGFENSWSMAKKDIPGYFEEIRSAKNKYHEQIEIYTSLEIDFIPDVVSPSDLFITELKLDYTIGSIHFVEAFEDGKPWEIDGSTALFELGLAEIHQNDIKKVVQKYFNLTRQMIRDTRPDIIGHIDKIKMHNRKKPFFSENERWYRNEVEETLKTLAVTGGIMEVNTRGLYKKYSDTPDPAPWVISRAYEMDIPVCINSDAHTPDEITLAFEYAASLVKEAGYDTIQVLLKDKWQSLPFDNQGVIIS
jgi:histidinol-phosphatase (PHP family)